MLPLEERSRYQPGVGISWPRLPMLLVGGVLTAAAVGWMLKFFYVNNWYLLVLVPAVGALVLGGVLYGLVGATHLRNAWLAGSVGVLMGAIAYLSYFQFCLMELAPVGWRVDLLPRYIVFRMETDVTEDIARAQIGQQRKDPAAVMNWLTFGFELLLLAGFTGAFAWNRARRAYCAELGRWMKRDIALLPAASGWSLGDALQAGQLAEFVARTPTASDNQMSCRLILEYADSVDDSVLTYPIYATLEDFPAARPWYRPAQMRSTLIGQVELEPAEVLALGPLFPELGRRLALQHAELRDLPPEIVRAEVVGVPGRELAEVKPVPEPFRQRVRGKGYAFWVNLHGAMPAVFLLGGGAIAGLGIWWLVDESVLLGALAIVAGAIPFAWGVYSAIYCLGVPENRWIQRRLRREIGQRSDALVEADDPDSIYVSLIPRESFVKVKWTMASDLLLLKLEARRRRILLEGDSDRYRIPAAAITVCEPQCFFHPMDRQHQNEMWMIRLVILVEEGSRELLLSKGHTHWTPMTNARRRRIAAGMCREINVLRGSEPGPA